MFFTEIQSSRLSRPASTLVHVTALSAKGLFLRGQGILNGIDTKEWDPASDHLIPAPFRSDRPEGKALCKQYLQVRRESTMQLALLSTAGVRF